MVNCGWNNISYFELFLAFKWNFNVYYIFHSICTKISSLSRCQRVSTEMGTTMVLKILFFLLNWISNKNTHGNSFNKYYFVNGIGIHVKRKKNSVVNSNAFNEEANNVSKMDGKTFSILRFMGIFHSIQTIIESDKNQSCHFHVPSNFRNNYIFSGAQIFESTK